jgi:hypothetical protein
VASDAQGRTRNQQSKGVLRRGGTRPTLLRGGAEHP